MIFATSSYKKMSKNNNKSKPGIFKTLRNALTLNGDFYENAHNTPTNRRIALIIVILAALSRAVGSAAILLINLTSVPGVLIVLLIDIIALILGYYFWTFSIWKIGQWLKPIDPTYNDLLSPIGFAYAPQVLNFLTVIPLLGRPIELILSLWSLLTVIIAIREGLDITTTKAMLICLLGWPFIQIAIGLVQVIEPRIVQLFT
jgi:hypothetical protein